MHLLSNGYFQLKRNTAYVAARPWFYSHSQELSNITDWLLDAVLVGCNFQSLTNNHEISWSLNEKWNTTSHFMKDTSDYMRCLTPLLSCPVCTLDRKSIRFKFLEAFYHCTTPTLKASALEAIFGNLCIYFWFISGSVNGCFGASYIHPFFSDIFLSNPQNNIQWGSENWVRCENTMSC